MKSQYTGEKNCFNIIVLPLSTYFVMNVLLMFMIRVSFLNLFTCASPSLPLSLVLSYDYHVLLINYWIKTSGMTEGRILSASARDVSIISALVCQFSAS